MTFNEFKEIIESIEDRYTFNKDEELELMFLDLDKETLTRYNRISLFLDISEVEGENTQGLTISAFNIED